MNYGKITADTSVQPRSVNGKVSIVLRPLSIDEACEMAQHTTLLDRLDEGESSFVIGKAQPLQDEALFDERSETEHGEASSPDFKDEGLSFEDLWNEPELDYRAWVTITQEKDLTLYLEETYRLTSGDVWDKPPFWVDYPVTLTDEQKTALYKSIDESLGKQLDNILSKAAEDFDKEADPLEIGQCYNYEDWCPINAENGEVFIGLSLSVEDIEKLTDRLPFSPQAWTSQTQSDPDEGSGAIQKLVDDGRLDVYAYISPDGKVRADIVTFAYAGESERILTERLNVPLTASEQHKIVKAVNTELEAHNIKLFNSEKNSKAEYSRD